MAHDRSGIRAIAPRRLAYNRVFDSTKPAVRLGGTQGTRHPVLQKPSSPRPQGLRCPEAEPATSNGRGLFLWGRGWRTRSIQCPTALIYRSIWDQRPLPLWGADIPQKAGSTRWNSGFQMRACASSTQSLLGRCRHRVTSRRAGCRPLRAYQACTPRKRRHGADFFASSGSIGRGYGGFLERPTCPAGTPQCAAWAERGMP